MDNISTSVHIYIYTLGQQFSRICHKYLNDLFPGFLYKFMTGTYFIMVFNFYFNNIKASDDNNEIFKEDHVLCPILTKTLSAFS